MTGSEDNKCGDCRHSRKFNTALKELLECRRFPPTVNPNYVALGSFPIVDLNTWCGEFTPKKIFGEMS
jgi:hypothetical protein